MNTLYVWPPPSKKFSFTSIIAMINHILSFLKNTLKRKTAFLTATLTKPISHTDTDYSRKQPAPFADTSSPYISKGVSFRHLLDCEQALHEISWENWTRASGKGQKTPQKRGVVSPAAHTDHLVYTLGTLGQCKARWLRSLKAWRSCRTRYWQVDPLNEARGVLPYKSLMGM